MEITIQIIRKIIVLLHCVTNLRDKICPLTLLVSPSSYKHLISPHIVTAWLNIQVMRIKARITKDKMSGYLSEFFQVVP